MTVNNSPNLAAYISVNSDPGPDYGTMTVLRVPTTSQIQGPAQIANVFKTQATISKDITLLDTGQSRIIHGNLLTLPIGNSFLYVEPLYVQSTYPTLQRVLVTYGDKIGYGAKLSDALSDLQPGHQPGETLSQLGSTTTTTPSSSPSTSPPVTGSTSPPASGSATTAPATSQAQLLAQLNQAFADLQGAYRSGDFTTIGRDEARVQQLLQQYESRYGTPASSATPTPTR
jgi:uncharacterized membrane protein (UPF0182 family)